MRIRRSCFVAFPLALLTLAGCATSQSTSLTFSEPPLAGIAVLELPTTVRDASVRRVLHRGHEKVDGDALAIDRQIIDDALASALTALAAPVMRVDEPTGQIGQALDADRLERIQAAQPARAYLRLEVTDYGETPRQWAGAYIAFEVATTAGIAAALALESRSVAGAYLLQESVEEVSEGYAGFWALNRLSRPIRLDADLVDGASGRVLWRAARTGLAPWRFGNLTHMSDETRDGLLAISMQKAVARTARAARDAAKREAREAALR